MCRSKTGMENALVCVVELSLIGIEIGDGNPSCGFEDAG